METGTDRTETRAVLPSQADGRRDFQRGGQRKRKKKKEKKEKRLEVLPSSDHSRLEAKQNETK